MLLLFNSVAFSDTDELQERIDFLENRLEQAEIEKKAAFCTNCISSAWNVLKNNKEEAIIKVVLQGVVDCVDSGFLDKKRIKSESKNMLEYALKNRFSFEVINLIHTFDETVKLPLSYLAAAVAGDLEQEFIGKIIDFSVHQILSSKRTSTWKEGSLLRRKNGFCYEAILLGCWSNYSPEVYKIKGKKVKTICKFCRNRKTFKLPFKEIGIEKRLIDVPDLNLTAMFDQGNDKINRILLSQKNIIKLKVGRNNFDLLMIYAVYGSSPRALEAIYGHSDQLTQNDEGLTAFQLALLYNENWEFLKKFIQLEADNSDSVNLKRSFPEDFGLYFGNSKIGSLDPKSFLSIIGKRELAAYIESKLAEARVDSQRPRRNIEDLEQDFQKINLVDF